MARKQYAGAAPQLTLAVAINSSATSFTSATTSALYPDGSVGNFVVVVGKGTATEEKILCSARAANVFTVATSGRGYDGTTAATHALGESINHSFDAASATDFAGHVYDTTRDDHTQYARLAASSQTFTGAMTVSGNVSVGGTLGVTGAATFSAAMSVSGVATLASATITGAATVGTTLNVTGVITGSNALKSVAAGGTSRLYLKSTDSASNAKVWDFGPNGNTLVARVLDDAESGTSTWMTVTRSGASVTGVAFAASMTVTGNVTASVGDLRSTGPGGTPRLYLKATDGDADAKTWDFMVSGSDLHGRLLNDAENTTTDWLKVIRSGVSVSSVAFATNDTYIGGYALGTGTGVSRLHASTGATSAGLTAEGDGSNRDIFLKPKGTGIVALEDSDSNVVAYVTNSRIHTAATITGLMGGNAPALNTRGGGNAISFSWDGTKVHVYVDNADIGTVPA